MNSKYMFTDETRLVVGHTLHRIRALKPIFDSLKNDVFAL